MRRETQRAAIAAEIYASAVIDLLAPEFPDLRNAETASIVRGHIYAHAREPGRMEVIVDSPYLARWRLVGDRDHPGRVRLGCWHADRGAGAQERLERLNEALRAIGTETQR